MKTCTFFGHRQIWVDIDCVLEDILIDLIENHAVTNFYVGNHGDFDRIVVEKLRDLKKQYPEIVYTVVLAYLPGNRKIFVDTIYPEGLENTSPRYAIVKRNRWMIDQSDVVITYINYSVGGAAQAEKYAKKKGKRVINIAESN